MCIQTRGLFGPGRRPCLKRMPATAGTSAVCGFPQQLPAFACCRHGVPCRFAAVPGAIGIAQYLLGVALGDHIARWPGMKYSNTLVMTR